MCDTQYTLYGMQGPVHCVPHSISHICMHDVDVHPYVSTILCCTSYTQYIHIHDILYMIHNLWLMIYDLWYMSMFLSISVSMYLSVYVLMDAYTWMCASIFVSMFTCMRLCTWAYVCARTCIRRPSHSCICISACIDTCTHVCYVRVRIKLRQACLCHIPSYWRMLQPGAGLGQLVEQPVHGEDGEAGDEVLWTRP